MLKVIGLAAVYAVAVTVSGCGGGGGEAFTEQTLIDETQTIRVANPGRTTAVTESREGSGFSVPAGAQIEVCSFVTWRQTAINADSFALQLENGGSFSDPARGNASAPAAAGAVVELTATACHVIESTATISARGGAVVRVRTGCTCLDVLGPYEATLRWRVRRLR